MKSIHNQLYKDIIIRLRNARINKNITQEELSERLHVPQSYISKVENCERRIDIAEFLFWIKALDVVFESIIPSDINLQQ